MMHDSSYIADERSFIATVEIDIIHDPFILYFICQSLPSQTSISTSTCVTGCAIFLSRNKGDSDEWPDYPSHSCWPSISHFSSLRYLVYAMPDLDAVETWAVAQHQLREFIDKRMFYSRLAHADPASNEEIPSWIGIDSSSLEKSGEYALYCLGMLSNAAFKLLQVNYGPIGLLSLQICKSEWHCDLTTCRAEHCLCSGRR